MEELRQEFLNEAISNLENLQKVLHKDFFISDSNLQEIFRRIHTIKGTSQTFGFNVSGNLAHEFENILSAINDNKIVQTTEIASIIKEGIDLLLHSLQMEKLNQANYPSNFIEKLKKIIPNPEGKTNSDIFLEQIPDKFLVNLSVRELNSLNAALQNGQNLFLIEVGFDFSNFDSQFKDLKEILSERGEIIATLPNLNVDITKELGFQIFFVSKNYNSEIIKLIAPFKGILAFESHKTFGSFDLKNILSQIVSNGEKTAQSLSKEINFHISTSDLEISSERLKTIYETLLHLTRNAIDHGIESPDQRNLSGKPIRGNIYIDVLNYENQIVLKVTDDGYGIDIEDVIDKAKQKNLITGEKVLTEKEALQIIFLHGFSTSENISKISGRGIGLDIVKEVIDDLKGNIKIQTKLGQGTFFEIFLPQ